MRAPIWLYVLAAGMLIAPLHLVWTGHSFYALCVEAETLVVVAHLFSVNHLMGHLRRFHPTTWAYLERPSIPTIAEHSANPWPFVQSGILLTQFVLSTQYKSLRDERLNQLIWLVRILPVCQGVGMYVLSHYDFVAGRLSF
jgi:hypothetical protein